MFCENFKVVGPFLVSSGLGVGMTREFLSYKILENFMWNKFRISQNLCLAKLAFGKRNETLRSLRIEQKTSYITSIFQIKIVVFQNKKPPTKLKREIP